MAAVIVLLAVGVLALPGLLAPLGRRLRPQEWASMTATSLAAGLVLLEVGLLFTALPTVLRFIGVDALAEACERVLAPLAGGGSVMGWTAGLLAVALAVSAVRVVRKVRRVRQMLMAELWLGEARHVGSSEVLVVPVGMPFAVALDGPDPSILISREMLDSLTPLELEAVVRHEAAHLTRHHGAMLVLAAALEDSVGRLIPPLRRSADALRFAIERCADEDAVADSPNGREVLRSALVAVACSHAPLPVPAFSGADTVVARVQALEHVPIRPGRVLRVAAYAPGVVLAAGAVTALTAWTGHAHMLLSMAGSCPL